MPTVPNIITDSPKIQKTKNGKYEVLLEIETSTSMKQWTTLSNLAHEEIINMQKAVKLFVDNLEQNYACFNVGEELIELNLTSNSFAQDVISFNPRKTWEKELLKIWRFSINFQEAENFVNIKI